MRNVPNISLQIRLLLYLSWLLIFGCNQSSTNIPKAVEPFEGVAEAHADSLLRTMTLEEKIGQLLVWEPDTAPDSAYLEDMLHQVGKGRVGGMLLKEIEIDEFFRFKLAADHSSALPLFWGVHPTVTLHNSFKGLPQMPSHISLAANDSVELQEQLEELFLEQCHRLGFNLTIGPALNSWNKSEDPNAYFALPGNVQSQGQYVLSFIKKLRNKRMLSIGYELEELLFIPNDTLRDSLNYLWKLAGNAGISGVLLDDAIFQYDTLAKSPPGFLKHYLAEQLSVHGLVISRLRKVESPYYKLLTGADVLLTHNPKRTFYSIVKLLERGRLTEAFLDKKVKKVLMAKAWMEGGKIHKNDDGLLSMRQGLASLTSYEPPISNLTPPDLRTTADVLAEDWRCYFQDEYWAILSKQLFEASVTLIRDDNKLLPMQWQRSHPVPVWIVSDDRMEAFFEKFSKYADYAARQVVSKYGKVAAMEFPTATDLGVHVVILDQVDLSEPKNDRLLKRLNAGAESHSLLLINFGYPYNLALLHPKITILQVYERNATTESAAAQIIFGGLPVSGKLPITINSSLREGMGVELPATRLGFDDPRVVGVDPERLAAIYAIVESAIDDKVFPGCQVVMAKDGKIVFSKAFGNYDYQHGQETSTISLYDVASVTKAAATTLAVMKLTDDGNIQLDTKLSEVLNLEESATVKEIRIGELLQHRSGLQAQMPIGKFLISKNVPAAGCNEFFCRQQKKGYDIQVCKDLFFNSNYKDSIFTRLQKLPVDPAKSFRYSDVNFVLLQKVVEEVSKKPLDGFVDSMFYLPLGLRYTTFNPLKRFSAKYIVPTENDRFWRKSLVHGFVHDPAAALLGGVSGNAGLFSTAEDLAVVFQMLLNGGTYGGRRYLSEATVKLFTESKGYEKRAYGFDKPANKRFPTYSDHVSKKTFGHTGFTGTCVWADPESRLIYVFLSNRVHPSAQNSKIRAESVRSRIHDSIYNALNSYQVALPTLPASLKND